jgi:hypothetical protein
VGKVLNGLNAKKAPEVFTKDIVYEDVALGVIFRGIDEFKGLPKTSS